jgi:hypothetical protein
MNVKALMHLRVLVATLGGSAHTRWWRTEFLTVAGLRFLERLYPRTCHAAAIQATAVAARAVHDASIGRGGVYHLFRLPEALEHDQRAAAEDGLFKTLLGDLEKNLESRDALLEQLSSLAPQMPQSPPGPQCIGSERDLFSNGLVLGRWAGAYFHAFRNDYRVFPYVDAERTR